jgi:hypothetical protein
VVRCRVGGWRQRRPAAAHALHCGPLANARGQCQGPAHPPDRPTTANPSHPSAGPCARTHQVVTSTDTVVGRASMDSSRAEAISLGGGGSSLRCERCRIEGGAEVGVGLQAGASAEFLGCMLGLSALGQACLVSDAGSSAVLRSCCVEGSGSGSGSLGAFGLSHDVPLHANEGGSIVLEGCAVDVGGAMAAALAEDPGGEWGAVRAATSAQVERTGCRVGARCTWRPSLHVERKGMGGRGSGGACQAPLGARGASPTMSS